MMKPPIMAAVLFAPNVQPWGETAMSGGMRALLFLLAMMILVFYYGSQQPSKSPQQQPPPQQAAQEAPPAPPRKVEPPPPPPPPPPPRPGPGEEVTPEFFNWIRREMVAVDCGMEIKKLATYDFRSAGVFWGHNTGDWALVRFNRYSKQVSSRGTMLLAGDEGEAQNALGNWLRVGYTCEIDLTDMAVKHVTLSPGNCRDHSPV
jgi:hypothetical protein